jgi:hypothetical protein
MSNPKPDGTTGNGTPIVPTRQRSTPYPRYSLRQAEGFAKTTFQLGPKGVNQEALAKKTGYSNPLSGPFKSLRASAGYFEMVEYSGDHISVKDEWIKVFHEEDPELTRQARQIAMLRPQLYRQLLETYEGKQVPTPERLARELHINQKYGIVREAADGAAKAFLESASYAGILDDRGFLQSPGGNQTTSEHSASPPTNESISTSDSDVTPTSYGIAGELQSTPSEVDPSSIRSVLIPSDLDRIEVKLRNGQKAYLFVPVPLHSRDKERLKKYIDLILDENEIDDEYLEE